MPRRYSQVLLSVFACLLFAEPAFGSTRDATKSRLRRGEIIVKTTDVKGSKYPKILAMAVIDVAPAKLWEVIGDCNAYKGNLPAIVEAKFIKRLKGNRERCKVVVSVPLLPNLVAVTDAVETVRPDKKYVRAWTLVRGDYRHNSGKWTLVPFESPQRTLAVYETYVIPKMKVPPKIQRMAIRNALPGLFKKLRRRMTERAKAK